MKETATGRAPRQSFYNPPYSLPFLGIPIPYLSGILGEGREQKNNRSSKIRIKKLGEKGRMSERGTRNQHLFWIHYLPGTVLDPWTHDLTSFCMGVDVCAGGLSWSVRTP